MMKTAEREPVTAWIDVRDRRRLFELAREHDRSVSSELRLAVAAHVSRENVPERRDEDAA